MDFLSDIWDSVTSFIRTIRDYLGDVILKTLGLGLACLLILLNWDVFDIVPQIWCCIRVVLLCFLRLFCILAGLFLLAYLLYTAAPESCDEKPRQNTSTEASASEPEPPANSEIVPKIQISSPEETEEASLAKDNDAEPENNLQSEDKAVDAKLEEPPEQAEGITQTDCVDETEQTVKTVPSDIMGPKARSLGIQSPTPKTENCDMNPAGRRMKPPDGRCGQCGGGQQVPIWPVPSCCAPCFCCMQAAQFAAAAKSCSPDPCFSPPVNGAAPYPCYFCLNRAANAQAQPENDSCRGNQPIPQESEEFHEEFWERFPTVKHSIDTQEIWKQSTPKPTDEKGHDPKVAAWLRQDEQSDKNKIKATSSSKDTSASAPMVNDVNTSFLGTDGKGRSGSVTGGKK